MKINGVFEGGGIRAIGIIGAINCFEDYNISWNRLAGTSAGAIIAALLSSGFSGKEINKLIINTNFLKFMDKDYIQKLPLIGKPLGLIKEKSIYSGDYMEEYLYKVLGSKGVYTFKDLKGNGKCKALFVACDITSSKPIILPDDLPDYDIDPDEFTVAKALRMSSSIPLYFKPVVLCKDSIPHYIVDGGIAYNYPIDIFDNENESFKTIGFKFELNETDSFTSSGRSDPIAFLYDLASSVPNENKRIHLIDVYKEKTVLIPTMGVKSTDFEIKEDMAISLYKAGYKNAKTYLRKFPEEKAV
ncbi:MAG: patatin-like phospholipase family protein [Bacillota bacterium]|nr:patatin-like phospholipase family protein [Bacillota bacterium]